MDGEPGGQFRREIARALSRRGEPQMRETTFDITGNVIIVTGATMGIGRGVS